MSTEPELNWAAAQTRSEREKVWFESWDKGYWDNDSRKPDVNLNKYFDELTSNRGNMRILVPLSAASYDPVWLFQKGHRVVATDLAEKGAREMFKMLNQQPVIQDVPQTKGKVYKTSDDRFKFYVGDFFLFSKDLEGQFDAIWDAGAMCAIDERDRQDYLAIIRSMMGPKCLMMLEFPKEATEGQLPYNFTEEQIKGFFGDTCDVKFLDEFNYDLTEEKAEDKNSEAAKTGQKDETDSDDMSFMLQCYTVRKRD